MIQIAFSYDTLVESKERIDEDEDDESEFIKQTDRHKGPSGNNENYKDSNQNRPNIEVDGNSASSSQNVKKTNIQGYFGSVLEIFGLNEEINTVGEEFYKLKESNMKSESVNGKAGKRRAPSG